MVGMDLVSGRKNRWIFLTVMGIVLLLQMALLLYYGGEKAGFHEDELYTYYSSNKTAGLFVNDRQWMEGDVLRNDFVVLPGEGFRYSVVKQMQSWDVHPPLYYYIFHTACSLLPGVFSKWPGIGVNLIAFVFCYVLLTCGAYMAAGGGGRGRLLAFLTCLFWGAGSAVISGVMFIRMYQWLTLFVLLCLDLHLWALRRNDYGVRRFLLPLGATVFLGFLTQYYYIIFHFFLGAGFCLFLLKNKRIKALLSYGAACALGLMGAILYYPASLSHIFRGYRGTEAVSEFGDMSNTWERLRFFGGLFDDFVMNKTLSWWLLALCLLAVTAGYLGKTVKSRREQAFPGGRENMAGVACIALACGGYFFTVSKTALVLGETSNRYQLPIYGPVIFLLLYGAWTLAERTGAYLPGELSVQKKRRGTGAVLAPVLTVILLLTDGMALKNGRVFFLYKEEKEIMEFVESHSRENVVVFYNEASPDHIWRLSDELMVYPRVFLAQEGNPEPVTDETIRESESLLVYAADHERREDCLEGLLSVNERLTQCRVVAEKGMWTLYELR